MKVKNNHFFRCVGLTVLLCAATGHASDRKSYTGVRCVEREEFNQVRSPRTIMYQGYGSVQNITLSWTQVVCGAVRDITGSDMDVADWDVTVRRGTYASWGSTHNSPWSVTLTSTNRTGYGGYSTTVTVPTGSGVYTIDGGAITSAHSLGGLKLHSELPAGGEVLSYSITEE